MNIGQKRVIHHLSEVIEERINTLTSEVAQLRKEIREEDLDQVDRDTLALYDNMTSMMNNISVSVNQIKIAKYNFEKDPGYGKVLVVNFSLGRNKHEI